MEKGKKRDDINLKHFFSCHWEIDGPRPSLILCTWRAACSISRPKDDSWHSDLPFHIFQIRQLAIMKISMKRGDLRTNIYKKITCLLFISKRFRHASKSHLWAERRIQLSCLPSTMKGMQCLPAGPAYLPLAKHGVELRGGFSEPRMNSIKA